MGSYKPFADKRLGRRARAKLDAAGQNESIVAAQRVLERSGLWTGAIARFPLVFKA